MACVFEITVSALTEDGDLLSRTLDFKEDLHRECYRGGDVSVMDAVTIDLALMPVRFRISSQAAVARFTKLIEKSLARHPVEDAARVLRKNGVSLGSL